MIDRLIHNAAREAPSSPFLAGALGSFTYEHAAQIIDRLAASGNEWVSLHRNFDPSEVEAPELTCNGTSEISMRNQFRAWREFMGPA